MKGNPTPRTPRKPIPLENLRSIRRQDREKMLKGQHRDPCPDGQKLLTSSPDGDRSSGNYITPMRPNPDDL